jgi:hypothetical protein
MSTQADLELVEVAVHGGRHHWRLLADLVPTGFRH